MIITDGKVEVDSASFAVSFLLHEGDSLFCHFELAAKFGQLGVGDVDGTVAGGKESVHNRGTAAFSVSVIASGGEVGDEGPAPFDEGFQLFCLSVGNGDGSRQDHHLVLFRDPGDSHFFIIQETAVIFHIVQQFQP